MILIQKIFNDKEYKIKLEVKNGLYFYTLTNNDKEIITFNRKDSPSMINPTASLVRDFVKEMNGKVTFTYLDEEKPIEEEDIKKRVLQSLKKLQQKLDDEEKQQEIKEKSLEKKQKINDEKASKFWEYHIYRFGLIPILEEYLGYIALGDKVNIYSKIINAYGVLNGEESYYQTTVASAEAGKSYQDDILYDHYKSVGLIPEEFVIILNDITQAAYRNKGLLNNRCYDKKIIYAGDKGEDFDEKLMEEMKSIVKILITDKRYISEKDDGTGTSGIEHIELYADSIAWVENSVLNIDKNDKGQRDTRSINYTIIPEDNDLIMDFEGKLISEPDGVLAWNFNQAFSLLKTFQSFLRKKVWEHEDRNIIIPEYMMNFLKDLYKDKEFGRREFKRHLIALRSFYELQTASGDCVDDATFNEYCELFINETTMPPLFNNLYLNIKNICNVPDNVPSLLDNAVKACDLNHKILDELNNEFVWDHISNWLDVTEDHEIQKVLKKLLQLYRVRNNDNNNLRYFFTTSDLKYRLRNIKSYKNVSDVSGALEVMQRNGLIDCLEEQVKINGNKYRIWYLL